MFDEDCRLVFPQPLVWKDVVGHEGYYKVSNYGQVKSLDREVTYVQRGKTVCRIFHGKILAPKFDKDGYEAYGLSRDQNKFHVRGHRLVATAFIPNPKNLSVVDHINGVVTSNTVWNLQWMTAKSNTIKYYAKEFGKAKTLSSLTRQEWLYIGWLYNEGVSYDGICENLGLTVDSTYSVWDGLSGRRLSSVSGFCQGDFKIRKHPTTKLSITTVAQIIKERKLEKTPLKVLSEKYKITESMISRFCSGKRQPEGLKLFKERYEL